MPLTESHIRAVCKLGQGEDQCRFLGSDRTANVCMKLGPEYLSQRTRIEKLCATGHMIARGDNCDGVAK